MRLQLSAIRIGRGFVGKRPAALVVPAAGGDLACTANYGFRVAEVHALSGGGHTK